MQREADDVEVATVDPFDKGAAHSLDPVGPGLVQRLPGGHVALNDVIGEVVEGHFGGFVENGRAFEAAVLGAQESDTWRQLLKTK